MGAELVGGYDEAQSGFLCRATASTEDVITSIECMKIEKTVNYLLVTLLGFAALSLLTGLYSGIGRMGVGWGGHQYLSPMLHGSLMINGFLGTLIGLERAAALEKAWAYGAPVFFAIGAVMLLFVSGFWAKLLFITASVFLVMIMLFLYRLQSEAYHLIMILGAACLLTGNILLFMGSSIFNLVVWWAGFLLLTIFAERLELNRIMRPPQRARSFFVALALLWIAGIILTYVDRRMGWTVASVSLIAQALWLFKYDVARRTIKARDWTRYSAIALLTGYGWLVAAGLFGLWYGLPFAGLSYDAQLHMIFVGFVFSMIFAHASVIIPSLSGKLIPYHSYFYIPLFLLHAFLGMRVIGDILAMPDIRIIGGHGNVLAILLFLGGILFQLGKQSFHKKLQTA